MTKRFEDSWKSIKPERRRGNNAKTTPRDGGNVSIGMAVGVVIVWIIDSMVGVPVPPTVAVAIGTISGYFLGRKLRY